MKLTNLALIALLVAAPAFSQPGPGMGGGMGPGGGRFAIDKDNTVGWTLMTPEERSTHRQKMGTLKTYDECKAYQVEHHQLMEARAKEKGQTIVPPRMNACDRMQVRGLFK